MPKKPKPEIPKVTGRPTKYRPEFPSQLVRHMAEGNSFESFAATAHVCFDTLYEWVQAHEDFSEAKKEGLARNLKFWEDLGKAGTSGQLRRVVSETPVIGKDRDGNDIPMLDPKTGQPMMTRTYAAATFSAIPYIFTMKNRFPKLYKDQRQNILVGDENGGAIRLKKAEPTADEKLREIKEYQQAMRELENAELLFLREPDKPGEEA